MTRRSFLVVGAVALLVLAMGSTVAAGNGGGRRLTVVERAETDTVVDLGPSGDTIGDLLAFGNPIYDATNVHRIGRDQGSCIRTNPGVSWECTWTTIVPEGSLTVEGPFADDGSDTTLAITGGTGAYRNARGQMVLHARDASSFDFRFEIVGG
ncbi:MAG TPA: dirigent protein [Candidatus Limnocylindrales bacterium]|nr:dirigent protein [Candidatus Limnocylindrales bacterium]